MPEEISEVSKKEYLGEREDVRGSLVRNSPDSPVWSGLMKRVLWFTCREVANTVQIVIKPNNWLDKEIATMGQFIADETGTTTRSPTRNLGEFR
jgi:hypothetical protein